MINAIECRGVTKRYPYFSLDGIDLTLPEGSVMGFVGPNGAGKSTTIRIIMGLVHAQAGEVRVMGHRMPEEQIAAKWEVGFMSEDMRLYPQRSIGYHMRFMQSVFERWDQAYAEKLLKRFGLLAEQPVKGLSHGQRVKAGLMLVLARRPRLLVLDEPTTGLDPVARHQILEELMAVISDETRSVLFSSHNTLDVEQISDYITFIQDGQIRATGEKEEFLERWRRLRLEVPDGYAIPDATDLVHVQQSGHVAVVTTDQFEPAMAARFEQAGASVTAVERLSLEEIFLASNTLTEDAA